MFTTTLKSSKLAQLCLAASFMLAQSSMAQSLLSCNETSKNVDGTNITITHSYPSGGVIAGCHNSVLFVTNNAGVVFENDKTYTISFSPAIKTVDFEMIGVSQSAADTFEVKVNGVDPTTDPNTALTTPSGKGNPVFSNSTAIQQSHDTGILITNNLVKIAQNSGSTFSEGGGTLSITNSASGISSVSLKFTHSGSGGFLPDSAAAEIWIKQTLSISENTLSETLGIFPNPAQNEFNFKAPADVTIEQIEIIDLSGKKVLQQQFESREGQVKVNIENLANGLYFVKTYTNKGVGLKRLIKRS